MRAACQAWRDVENARGCELRLRGRGGSLRSMTTDHTPRSRSFAHLCAIPLLLLGIGLAQPAAAQSDLRAALVAAGARDWGKALALAPNVETVLEIDLARGVLTAPPENPLADSAGASSHTSGSSPTKQGEHPLLL